VEEEQEMQEGKTGGVAGGGSTGAEGHTMNLDTHPVAFREVAAAWDPVRANMA